MPARRGPAGLAARRIPLTLPPALAPLPRIHIRSIDVLACVLCDPIDPRRAPGRDCRLRTAKGDGRSTGDLRASFQRQGAYEIPFRLVFRPQPQEPRGPAWPLQQRRDFTDQAQRHSVWGLRALHGTGEHPHRELDALGRVLRAESSGRARQHTVAALGGWLNPPPTTPFVDGDRPPGIPRQLSCRVLCCTVSQKMTAAIGFTLAKSENLIL